MTLATALGLLALLLLPCGVVALMCAWGMEGRS